MKPFDGLSKRFMLPQAPDDISGYQPRFPAISSGEDGSIDLLNPGKRLFRLQLLPSGLAAIDQNALPRSRGQKAPNPRRLCVPPGIPHQMVPFLYIQVNMCINE